MESWVLFRRDDTQNPEGTSSGAKAISDELRPIRMQVVGQGLNLADLGADLPGAQLPRDSIMD